MIWEELQRSGWVDFGVAQPAIAYFFADVGSEVEPGSEADLVSTDLIHLTAAELALPQGLSETRPPNAPFFLEVPEEAARLAPFTADCGPFKGHNPRDEPKLWDVTLYGSDASKLAWLARTGSVQGVAERFVEVVSRLADMHQALRARRNVWLGDEATTFRPEVFAVRATLWRAKIGVLLGEDDIGDVLENVHAAASGGAIA